MIYKYYIDYLGGSGFEEIEIYDNTLTWRHVNDINPAIYRIRLDGSCSFKNDVYDNIIAASDNYLGFKIEGKRISDSVYQTIFDGFFDKRGTSDENKRKLSVGKFRSKEDMYDTVQNFFKRENNFNLYLTASYLVNGLSTTTTTLTALYATAGLGLTPAQYQAAYDIDGNALQTAATDPRWVYFLFTGTNPDTSHNFDTMSFDARPPFDAGFTEIDIRVNLGLYFKVVKKWVKLPPFAGATESWVKNITGTAFPLGDMITSVVADMDITVPGTATKLSFDLSTDITYTNLEFDKMLIAEASTLSRVSGYTPNFDSVISFSYFTELFENFFDMYWYIDGTHIKFLHPSEFTNTGTLDLTAITQDLKEISTIEPDIPDYQSWLTRDYYGTAPNDTFGRLDIKYGDVETVVANTKIIDINVFTNIPALHTGDLVVSKNDYALMLATTNTGQIRTILGFSESDYNFRLGLGSMFGDLNYWLYDDNAEIANRTKLGLIVNGTRPIERLNNDISIDVDSLIDFDVRQEIITAAGNGRVAELSCELLTNNCKLKVDLFQ